MRRWHPVVVWVKTRDICKFNLKLNCCPLFFAVHKPTKFDKVVKREICRIQTKGTKVYSFIDGDTAEAKSAYLLAVCERVCAF